MDHSAESSKDVNGKKRITGDFDCQETYYEHRLSKEDLKGNTFSFKLDDIEISYSSGLEEVVLKTPKNFAGANNRACWYKDVLYLLRHDKEFLFWSESGQKWVPVKGGMFINLKMKLINIWYKFFG
ncbi:hypothetical protein CSB11_00495 [Candidatus Campbellbacteria bacterium]|nr:MAG: hypothetical protein CSB11_00495 [Candidatus Campbellbacteria bacterium]